MRRLILNKNRQKRLLKSSFCSFVLFANCNLIVFFIKKNEPLGSGTNLKYSACVKTHGTEFRYVIDKFFIPLKIKKSLFMY